MDTARMELKPSSLVRIVAIGGDLRLTGADSQRLEAQAGRRGGLRGSTKGEGGESVGGDARLEKLEGDLRLRSVAGDLRLTALEGSLEAHVGGDASVSFSPRGGTRSVPEADGDVKLRVPLGASLRAELKAVGDLRVEATG